ncbi:hypothetical protein B9Z55_007905 [Caenorhabditis nigoni]|uniref:Uncharacterized protein n=1 Tax=Caenorhabditis nigoni TaxID=1611254 RepID=A0A2G5VBT3_9PELO|nr:hypothetical protein B9Z55_007905 [Caenorhabditis nigoni]
MNINIKSETPIWARELTEDQLSFYPTLPGYEHEIDMTEYQNCMKDSRNWMDDDVKHKNIVVFVVLEEIGKFEKLWGSRCPGKEHQMWPLVGYNVYGRLGVPISLATIKNVFAEQRAKLRQRLSTIIKSNTAISVEDLEERLWKFPEYPLIRYYRKQTQDLEKRLRWSGIIGNDGKHIEIFLDEEDRDFEEHGFVEPVRDSEDQEGQNLEQGDERDGQGQAGQGQASNGQKQASHGQAQASNGLVESSHGQGQTSHGQGQARNGQGQFSKQGQDQNRRESIENQEPEKQISRRASRSEVGNRTPGNLANRPRASNGRFLSTKSRKRRPKEPIFEQSGPLLPQHLQNQNSASGAHDCQQTPGPSTRSQAHRQTLKRQNLRNNRQQNPIELPPMNRPPPPYAPVQQVLYFLKNLNFPPL